MKDQFRKRKISLNQNGFSGSSSVEERYQPPAVEEDYWIPTRPNSNTKIETLPGAQNLGEIDDAIYFRLKLMTALNFPKNYLNVDDPAQTKITLSSQDVKFARTVERYQSSLEDGLYEIAQRHLHMRGFPPETYEDLKITMTPPSEWRELSRAEIVNNRIQNVTSLKSAGLISDYDLLRTWMHYTEEETKDMLPFNALVKVNVRSRSRAVLIRPKQFGPTTLTLPSLAIRTTSFWSVLSPSSAKPADTTITLFTCFLTASTIISGTLCEGTITSTKSTGSLISESLG
jgi:hypothetical protein